MTALLANMTVFFNFAINQLTDIIDMIIGNTLVYTPVLIALLGGIVMYAISMVRRLGVRGISSAGGRRRRGRR